MSAIVSVTVSSSYQKLGKCPFCMQVCQPARVPLFFLRLPFSLLRQHILKLSHPVVSFLDSRGWNVQGRKQGRGRCSVQRRSSKKHAMSEVQVDHVRRVAEKYRTKRLIKQRHCAQPCKIVTLPELMPVSTVFTEKDNCISFSSSSSCAC